MNLPRLAIEKQTVTTALVILMMTWGLVVFYNISRREDPEIIIRVALMVTSWPGAEACKVEQLVTRPLERAIKEVAAVKRIISDSRVGLSVIKVRLHDNVLNTDVIWNKIRAKIQRVHLPQGCSPPDFNTDFGDVAVMVLGMYQVPLPGKQRITRPYSMREMDDMLKVLEDALQEIPMVGKIEKFGLQKEVIYIECDGREWGQLAIGGPQLRDILRSRNTIAPGGSISSANIEYTIKPSGEFLSPAQIKSVIVDTHGGTPIHLSDLNLSVSRRYEEPRTKYTRFCSPDYPLPSKRCDCVVLSLSMRKGYNVVSLGKRVRQCIAMVSATLLPPDIHIEILSDQPRQVSERIRDFMRNLWQAITIVLGVAILLIGPRVSIIMAAAIPLSIITAIGSMELFKVDLEQCSIASLIIALGMLVDNAVVVSDNVLRLIEQGYSKREAAWRGAQQLFVPILTSTLTTVAAFLPMLTIPGDMGEYIRSLPIVVSSTLMISLLVAMTLTPLMCFHLLKERSPDKPALTVSLPSRWRERAAAVYARLLRWCLNHQFSVLSLVALCFIASLGLVPVIGTAFFPKALRDQFVIEINLPAGSSIAQTARIVHQVEDILLQCGPAKHHGRQVQRFKNVLTYIGMGGPRFYISIDQEPPKNYYAQMMVNTISRWYTQDFIQEVRDKLLGIAGAQVMVRTLDMGPPLKTPIAFRIRGKDPKQLLALARQVESYLEQIPGTLWVHNSWGKKSYQLCVDVDEDAANLAGVNHLVVANTLYGYFSGTKLTTYREGRHEIDVLLRVKPEQRENLDYLDYLYIEGQHGKIPLNAIARVTPSWQVSLIQRRNLIRTIEVRAYTRQGYLSNKIVQAFLPIVHQQMAFPPGYWLEVGGEAEKTKQSQGYIAHALKISLLLIILTLIVQFNSYLKPLVILLTVPLALTGALLGLWVSGWALGFMPILGMVSLCGVVVNNAIILVDFIQNAVGQGMPLREAVVRAGQMRMRPILITTLTTVGGFVPLAMAGGPLWEGLAYVMICGLLLATLLTLVVIPLVFTLFAEHLGMRVVVSDMEGQA